MQRREFLTQSLAASALSLAGMAKAQATAAQPREYYQLRRYTMQNGPRTRLTEAYFSEALLPALQRLGMGPVGAFRLEYGPETPAFYLLVPSLSLEKLATLDLLLAEDESFVEAAKPFWSAPAAAPAFVRVDSSLLAAFAGWPRLTPPAAAAADHAKRIFQMRTYESPSYADHVRKVEMFNGGEFAIFSAAGFHNVFFGDTLVGPRQPQLTYMLGLPGLDRIDACWDAFRNDPAWKKLSSSPRYAYEEIVSGIANLVLSPLGCSQV